MCRSAVAVMLLVASSVLADPPQFQEPAPPLGMKGVEKKQAFYADWLRQNAGKLFTYSMRVRANTVDLPNGFRARIINEKVAGMCDKVISLSPGQGKPILDNVTVRQEHTVYEITFIARLLLSSRPGGGAPSYRFDGGVVQTIMRHDGTEHVTLYTKETRQLQGGTVRKSRP